MLCDQQRAAGKVGRAQDDRELKRRCLHLEKTTEPAGYQAADGQIPDHVGVDRDTTAPMAPGNVDNNRAGGNASTDGVHGGNTLVRKQAMVPQHRDEKRIAVEAERTRQKTLHAPRGTVAATD